MNVHSISQGVERHYFTYSKYVQADSQPLTLLTCTLSPSPLSQPFTVMFMMWQRHQCGPERANVSQVSQTAYELFSRLNNSKLLPFPALFLLALVSSICLSSKPNISNVSVPFSISLSISANYLRRPVQHGLAIHYSHSLIVFLFPLHFFESCMLLMCPLVGHL